MRSDRTTPSPGRLRWLALGVVLVLAAAACGDDDGDDGGAEPTDGPDAPAELDLVSAGSLTVCTDAPYPPFEYEEDGEWTGFDMDLLREIATANDLDLAVVVLPFDGIWLAPAAGDCDLVASAMTILPEREENALFSDPYYDSGQSLLVRADDAETFADLESLSGARIGVQTGTTGADYARENAPDDATIVEYDEPAALFLALQGGDVDAILQDLPVNAERAAQDDLFTLVGDFPTEEQYGFAVELGNDALIEVINDGLADLQESGRYDEIYSAYFG